MPKSVGNPFIFSAAAAFDRDDGTTVTSSAAGILMADSEEAAYRMSKEIAYNRFPSEDGWYARSWGVGEWDGELPDEERETEAAEVPL